MASSLPGQGFLDHRQALEGCAALARRSLDERVPASPRERTDSGVGALREAELEAGTVEECFEPVGNYQVSCCKTMRSEAPDDCPELAASSR